MITKWGASPILLSQYWKDDHFDGAPKNIFRFFGAPIIFSSTIKVIKLELSGYKVGENNIGAPKKRNNFWCSICMYCFS